MNIALRLPRLKSVSRIWLCYFSIAKFKCESNFAVVYMNKFKKFKCCQPTLIIILRLPLVVHLTAVRPHPVIGVVTVDTCTNGHLNCSPRFLYSSNFKKVKRKGLSTSTGKASCYNFGQPFSYAVTIKSKCANTIVLVNAPRIMFPYWLPFFLSFLDTLTQ